MNCFIGALIVVGFTRHQTTSIAIKFLKDYHLYSIYDLDFTTVKQLARNASKLLQIGERCLADYIAQKGVEIEVVFVNWFLGLFVDYVGYKEVATNNKL